MTLAEARKELFDFATVGDGLLGRASLAKKLDTLLSLHAAEVTKANAEKLRAEGHTQQFAGKYFFAAADFLEGRPND